MKQGLSDHSGLPRLPQLCVKRTFVDGTPVEGQRAIKITLHLGWSGLELGGVGLARLQFWLQNADFGLLGKDGVLVTH